MGDESPMNYGKRYIRVRGGVVHDDHELHRQREPIGYDPHRWAEKPKKTRARKTR